MLDRLNSAWLALRAEGNAKTLSAVTVLILGLWLFYPIENHSEAEDAFMFAADIREMNPRELVEAHPPHYLFHVTAKVLWTVCGRPNAFVFLQTISAVAGLVAAVMLGLILRQRFLLSRSVSILGFLLFLSLYNVWRYAHEAEVYAAAWMAGLFGMSLALGRSRPLTGGFLGGLFTGFHWMGALLAGPALALALWARDGFRPALRYGVAVCLGIVLMAAIPRAIRMAFPAPGSTAQAAPEVSAPLSTTPAESQPVATLRGVPKPKALLREAMAFGSTLLAGNWLFYDPATAARLEAIFPEKNVSEEIMLGQAMPSFLFRVNLVSFIASAAAFAAVCFCAFLPRRSAGPAVPEFAFPDWRLVLLGVWMLAYLVAQLAIGAAAPESWSPLIPAAAMLFALGLSHSFFAMRPRLGLAAVVLIFGHNFFGGIAPLRAREDDWNFRASAWLIDHADANDTVLTYNLGVLARYLHWHSRVKIADLGACANEAQAEQAVAAAQAEARLSGGRIFALEEVLAPPAYLLKLQHPPLETLRARWAAEKRWTKVDGSLLPLYQFNPL